MDLTTCNDTSTTSVHEGYISFTDISRDPGPIGPGLQNFERKRVFLHEEITNGNLDPWAKARILWVSNAYMV